MDELTLMQLAVFMRSRDYAEKTIQTYVKTNRAWKIEAAEINREAIQEWVWSADTQSKRRHRWLAMRRLVECLQDLDVLDARVEYTARMRMPQEALKVQPSLDNDVLVRLVAACAGRRFIDKRDKAILLVLASTGMRAGELMRLQIGDVNLEGGTALVRARGVQRGKTGQERVTYLDTDAIRALLVYLRARSEMTETSLWLTSQGSACHPDVLRSVLTSRSKGLGVRVTPHMFRRRLAIVWLARGGSQAGLQSAAGWTTPHMASHYTKVAAAEIARLEHARIFGGSRPAGGTGMTRGSA